ncbi:hypothetical protein [Wenyingzhuangia marina]|uniref:hypothetical protein n=1 Tax=Wenyingzhuangia marina TaxID=1195760 RepID=UPI0013562D29|nr:hypothetical protein [Wenyingzhuangia marina]GGF66673.1 hypothetical protein GCM10011397_07200 [Wenyingzhuangia marina]
MNAPEKGEIFTIAVQESDKPSGSVTVKVTVLSPRSLQVKVVLSNEKVKLLCASKSS